MIIEIINLFRDGLKKYIQFWSFIEWSIIILSWTLFSIYFYKLNEANNVLSFFQKTAGYGYKNFEKINARLIMTVVA